MLHAIRVTLLSLVVLASLYACGGQSSGESSGTSTSSTPPTITPPSSSDAISGKAFYEQSALGCIGCHGTNGEGGVFNAINTVTPDTCPSCTDVATLAADIAATMPTGANSSMCTGTTSGTCAHDIAVYMMESWINAGVPAPQPGISISSPSNNIATSEDGNTATISFVLDTEPTSDVNISLSSSDITEGTINPANLITLTFNSGNWNINQDVVITGQDDIEIDGDIQYTINILEVMTADPNYMGFGPDTIPVTNTDNEVFIPAGITVNPMNGLTTSENSTSASFTVALDTMPTQDVTIGLTSSNTNEGTVSPSSLTFTNLDYNAKTVTVTGVDGGYGWT